MSDSQGDRGASWWSNGLRCTPYHWNKPGDLWYISPKSVFSSYLCTSVEAGEYYRYWGLLPSLTHQKYCLAWYSKLWGGLSYAFNDGIKEANTSNSSACFFTPKCFFLNRQKVPLKKKIIMSELKILKGKAHSTFNIYISNKCRMFINSNFSLKWLNTWLYWLWYSAFGLNAWWRPVWHICPAKASHLAHGILVNQLQICPSVCD